MTEGVFDIFFCTTSWKSGLFPAHGQPSSVTQASSKNSPAPGQVSSNNLRWRGTRSRPSRLFQIHPVVFQNWDPGSAFVFNQTLVKCVKLLLVLQNPTSHAPSYMPGLLEPFSGAPTPPPGLNTLGPTFCPETLCLALSSQRWAGPELRCPGASSFT